MRYLPKKLLAAVLAGALTLSQAAAVFSDTSGHWVEGAISKWSEEYSIINGYDDGTFRPDASYLKFCRYKLEASAVGAALIQVEHFLQNL